MLIFGQKPPLKFHNRTDTNIYIVPQSAATPRVHTNFGLSRNYIGHGTFTFGDFGPAAKEVEIASG